MEKKITTNQFSYPQLRNFVGLPVNIEFSLEKDVFKILLNLYFRFTRKTIPLLQFLHYKPFSSKKAKRHFFNTITFNNSSWYVTFETTIPRLANSPRWVYDIAIRQLNSMHCKKIIAISKNAYALQVDYMKREYPHFLDNIKSKMIVLLPPQKALINNYSEKRLKENRISLTIVGADFFRKGGREVLNVLDRLIPKHSELELTIVSSMNFGDYASKTKNEDFKQAMSIINKYPYNIFKYENLSNEEVLEIFRGSHVGLLPTWGETFGYSVLEAQAAACPVISTDLRALPEINNNDIGWVINVPKLKDGNGDIGTKAKRKNFQLIIESHLTKIILEIINNPSLVKAKGEKAFTNICTNHSLEKNAKILDDIYNG